MSSSSLVLAAMVAVAAAQIPTFNNSKCPHFSELQSPNVKANFTKADIPGYYYELALHDITQFPLCPSKPRCITSNKTVKTHDNGIDYIDDQWNLFCLGGYYPQTLLFNATQDPGYFEGYVPVTSIPFLPAKVVAGLIFPDTIVDFKGGPDGWLLEFQCVEFASRVAFIGVNFYAKKNDEASYQEMLAAGKARGIDFYWDQGLGLSRVNQTDCPDPPPPKA